MPPGPAFNRFPETARVNDQPKKDPARRTPSFAGFPRQARLTKPREFSLVFAKPMVSADRCFKVLACEGAGQRARLGMAVSRQVERRAVGRHRIKRVIRESFRRYFLGGQPCLDIVVLPRRESASISNQQLSDSLERHWGRLRDKYAAASRVDD